MKSAGKLVHIFLESGGIFVRRDSTRDFFAVGNPVEILWNLRPALVKYKGWNIESESENCSRYFALESIKDGKKKVKVKITQKTYRAFVSGRRWNVWRHRRDIKPSILTLTWVCGRLEGRQNPNRQRWLQSSNPKQPNLWTLDPLPSDGGNEPIVPLWRALLEQVLEFL